MTLSLNYGIRPITLADEPFLWEMLYRAIYVPEGTSPPSRDIAHHPEMRRYVQHWGQPHDIGIVAIDRKSAQPIGAAWLRLLTGLLSHLLTTAQAHYPAVSLSVSADNPALRLYQRLGFDIVGRCGTSLTMRRKSSEKPGGDPHALCPATGEG